MSYNIEKTNLAEGLLEQVDIKRGFWNKLTNRPVSP